MAGRATDTTPARESSRARLCTSFQPPRRLAAAPENAPFPYSIPADSLGELYQVQAAAALLGQLGQPVDGLGGLHQLGGMSAVIRLIAERLNRIIDDIDAASTLPRASGEGKIDAR